MALSPALSSLLNEELVCLAMSTFLNPALFPPRRTCTDWQIVIATPNGQEGVGVYPQA